MKKKLTKESCKDCKSLIVKPYYWDTTNVRIWICIAKNNMIGSVNINNSKYKDPEIPKWCPENKYEKETDYRKM